MDFTFNDENIINNYGFAVLNSGGDFSRFEKNPVMLKNHNKENLIGKWENWRIENNLLLGTANFDEGLELGKSVKGQVERGYLKACSMGLRPLEWEIINGVKTCTKWDLYEVSIVALPSNSGALRLYHQDGTQMTDNEIKLYVNTNNNINNKMTEPIKLSVEAASILSLGVEPTAKDLSAAIMELQAKRANAESKLAEYEREKQQTKKDKAEKLVKLAIDSGCITADTKEGFLKLAMQDYNACETILSTFKKNTIGDVNQSNKNNLNLSAGRENWTYDDWRKTDMQGLKNLQLENKEHFDLIYKAHMETLKNI